MHEAENFLPFDSTDTSAVEPSERAWRALANVTGLPPPAVDAGTAAWNVWQHQQLAAFNTAMLQVPQTELWGERFGNLPLFGSYWWDARLEMYHVRHRVYDPELGRWLQRDPIGYAGGDNLYSYGGEMPMSGVDPMGLWFEELAGQINDSDSAWRQEFARQVGEFGAVAESLFDSATGMIDPRSHIATFETALAREDAHAKRAGREPDVVDYIFAVLGEYTGANELADAGIYGIDGVTGDTLSGWDRFERGGTGAANMVATGAGTALAVLKPLPPSKSTRSTPSKPSTPSKRGFDPHVDMGAEPLPGERGPIQFPNDRSKVGHIFRDAEGHFPYDTPENRAVIEMVANDPTIPEHPKGAHAGVTEKRWSRPYDGVQIWVELRNGTIRNAGRNLPGDHKCQ